MHDDKKPRAKRGSARRTRRKAGDLEALRLTLWTAIKDAEALMLSAGVDEVTRLRAAHAIAQVSANYLKLFEAFDVDGRLRRLEEDRERRTDGRDLP